MGSLYLYMKLSLWMRFPIRARGSRPCWVLTYCFMTIFLAEKNTSKSQVVCLSSPCLPQVNLPWFSSKTLILPHEFLPEVPSFSLEFPEKWPPPAPSAAPLGRPPAGFWTVPWDWPGAHHAAARRSLGHQ